MREENLRSAAVVFDNVSFAETQADQAEFMVLHDGRIYFEGTAAQLLASPDTFLRQFLFMTLPPW
jgi:ABC-type transporter Mla maintaining outer membrane lipid asymmetry ATPase subunit MlaF